MIKIRPDKDIGSNIQKARKSRGLTQDQTIAKLNLMVIEISRSTYAKIETNRINVRCNELIAWSRIFDVDFNYFFNDILL